MKIRNYSALTLMMMAVYASAAWQAIVFFVVEPNECTMLTLT